MMDRSGVGLRSSSFRPKMVQSLILLLALNAVSLTNAFIVPEELPSILSLVYSNIPPIKKGTDSRIGFGFRLGEHADFQVQLELGPQLNTRPIGAAAGSSKRYVDNDDYTNSVRNPPRSTSWLEAWSKQTKQRQQFNKDKLRDSLMPPAPIMNEGAYNQLQQLYEMNKQREYEDTIGTLPAEVLETRINQLKALHNPVNQFKPMPSVASDEGKSLSSAAEPSAESSAHVIVVTASPPESEVTGTTTTSASSTTTAATVDVARRNVRRRTNRPTSPRDKERITAQLSDVSLD
ncbi:uncharacterized protein LOC126572609 [Anopheles aquasalis]|uniref:uncharacterized protein LOC126572609 n=1 Tax=Anopheles aquasalis TaxID=42839 RepID=UPI00215B1086|nr:uncharacterized protein LOC126572609 [Anopheles aquasalis]